MEKFYRIQFHNGVSDEWQDRTGSRYSFDADGLIHAQTDLEYCQEVFKKQNLEFRIVIATVETKIEIFVPVKRDSNGKFSE